MYWEHLFFQLAKYIRKYIKKFKLKILKNLFMTWAFFFLNDGLENRGNEPFI